MRSTAMRRGELFLFFVGLKMLGSRFPVPISDMKLKLGFLKIDLENNLKKQQLADVLVHLGCGFKYFYFSPLHLWK